MWINIYMCAVRTANSIKLWRYRCLIRMVWHGTATVHTYVLFAGYPYYGTRPICISAALQWTLWTKSRDTVHVHDFVGQTITCIWNDNTSAMHAVRYKRFQYRIRVCLCAFVFYLRLVNHCTLAQEWIFISNWEGLEWMYAMQCNAMQCDAYMHASLHRLWPTQIGTLCVPTTFSIVNTIKVAVCWQLPIVYGRTNGRTTIDASQFHKLNFHAKFIDRVLRIVWNSVHK